MKNITFAVVVLLVFVAGFLFWKSSTYAPGEAGDQINVKTVATESAEISGSKYIEYNQTAFENSAGKKRVLFFYASWCPICRPADSSFKENTNLIPDDVVVIRVNFNDPDTDENEKELAKKYQITYQHTYVLVDSAGNLLKKWNSGEIDELLQNIK